MNTLIGISIGGGAIVFAAYGVQIARSSRQLEG